MTESNITKRKPAQMATQLISAVTSEAICFLKPLDGTLTYLSIMLEVSNS